MSYRDASTGLKNQIAVRKLAIERLRTELTAALWPFVPLEMREALERGSSKTPSVDADTEDLAALATADARLEAIESSLNAAFTAARDRAASWSCPDDIDNPSRPQQEPMLTREAGDRLALRRALADRIWEVADSPASVHRWYENGYTARFRRDGIPFVLIVHGSFDTEGNVVSSTNIEAQLRTTVPPTLAFLARSETVLDTIAEKLGLAKDVFFDDPQFDPAYRVSGDPLLCRPLLDPGVRAALLSIRAFTPHIRVAEGVASLHWRTPGLVVPDDAFNVLSRLRQSVNAMGKAALPTP